MPMDPFMNGLLALFAGRNPEQAGPMLDGMGIPAPGGAGPMGGGGIDSFAKLMDPTAGTMTPPDAEGVSNPIGSGVLGGEDAVPGMGPKPPMMLGGPTAPSTLGGPPTPEMMPSASASASAISPLQATNAAMKGIVRPAPVQPVTVAGVVGGVKPPELTNGVKASAPAIQALLQAAMSPSAAGKNPLRVPTLGDLIRG